MKKTILHSIQIKISELITYHIILNLMMNQL